MPVIICREISTLSGEYLQRDSAAARSYSTFLLEVSDMLPDVVLPVISILLPFLENDVSNNQLTIDLLSSHKPQNGGLCLLSISSTC